MKKFIEFIESITNTIVWLLIIGVVIVGLTLVEMIDWIYFKITRKHTKIYDGLDSVSDNYDE